MISAVISIWCMQSHAHTLPHMPIVWHVSKLHAPLMFMTLVWDIGTKKMKDRTKTSNWMGDHFSLTFVNLLLAWMLYFHVWLQNEGKLLVWSEYYNQFGIYQPSLVSMYLRTTAIQLKYSRRYIQNPVKYLRWSFLWKLSMTKSR